LNGLIFSKDIRNLGRKRNMSSSQRVTKGIQTFTVPSSMEFYKGKSENYTEIVFVKKADFSCR
jgi:hypothetical protein